MMGLLEQRWYDMLREWNGGILPGRNDHPAALFDLYWEQQFGDDLDLLALAVEDAWTSAEFPMRNMDTGSWLDFFNELEFLDNSSRTRPPVDVPVLYRAAAAGHERGMSWTDSYEQALWFYRRNVTYGFETVMLKITPHPSDLLAHFHGENSRNENEWVVRPEAADDAERVKGLSE